MYAGTTGGLIWMAEKADKGIAVCEGVCRDFQEQELEPLHWGYTAGAFAIVIVVFGTIFTVVLRKIKRQNGR